MTLRNLRKFFSGKTVLAAVLPLLCLAAALPAFSQTAEIRAAGVYYVDGAGTTTPDINAVYCNWPNTTIFPTDASSTTAIAKNYKGAVTNVGNHQTNDPWDTSALIEYDQPYPSPKTPNKYPNHCLALCFDVYCTNKPAGQSTYSIAFPIQRIRFDIARYYGSKDIVNPDTNPAIRTINMSIVDNRINGQGKTLDVSEFTCGSYHCWGATNDFDTTYTCPAAQYYCTIEKGTKCSGSTANCLASRYCKNASGKPAPGGQSVEDLCGNDNKVGKCVVFDGNGKESGKPMTFCTSWDGSYEIMGEFGKTNGQFGFRANVHTDFPGDGDAIESITIDDTFLYPGDAQYPIQVDVTNVHTVRATATVVGVVTPVQATPYSIAYRLSKDADVRMQVFDASAAIPYTGSDGNATGTFPGASDNSVVDLILKQASVVRHVIDWQPRLGEGMKGSDNDKYIVESEQWDGRDDDGRLLPANNYLISIQAKSQDEWPGTDFSRAVTRQISLDPLKLTDIRVQGLNKQSTAYATVRYIPTEGSKVYFEVYSPGTTFDSTYTKGYEATGTAPAVTPNTGVLVYRSEQQRARALDYPDKWDGLCHNASGCKIPYAKGTKLPISGTVFDGTTCTDGTVANGNCVVTYANGAPLPDGDYVYVLWAEVPYTDVYYNGAACYPNPAGCATPRTDDAVTAKNGTFTGVKTQRYYTGVLPVERGVVDITIQPVSYSTIGSSPTAYGLDPFLFKYSIAREAVVNAYVKNTAGVIVKTLTDEGGNTNVAQQMNTLSWDGRDDQGRMVGPGTYLFVVETSDPMFPNSVKTQASAIFPVDLYRVVDVSTTDVYGDSEAKATISYSLSKAMAVQVNVYNKDIVIPAPKATGNVETASWGTVPVAVINELGAQLPGLAAGTAIPATVPSTFVTGDTVGYKYLYTEPVFDNTTKTYTYYRVRKNVTAADEAANTETYVVDEVLSYTVKVEQWPPRVCDLTTDGAAGNQFFHANGYVDPAKNPTCIYVNDKTFKNYPANANAAKYNYTEGAAQTLDVRLQPVKTFNRSANRAGDGVRITEEWDAQYFYNPTPVSVLDGGKNSVEAVNACKNATDLTKCPYEMVPDGQYPFYIAAQTDEAVDLYYDRTTAAPFRDTKDVIRQTGLYATDKPVYRVNVTRGPVYFLDGTVAVYPNAPQLFNTSSGPVFVPPYEINFAISRAATVEVAIVALENGLCSAPGQTTAAGTNVQMAKAGDVCKYLSTMTIVNTPNFDPNITRKIYWDGTDNNGFYVRNGNYEIRLTAKNYPDAGLYQPTVKQITQNVDLLKVYDLPETEAYAINKRGTDMKISYQISVPMKVAIQIFKPGTTIYDYQKGTLRDPATGKEVKDINDVLVRSIVGIRPSTTLIEEVWDGRDYAQQDVPDGTYPFRFVTALQSADIDTITGEIIPGDDLPAIDPTQRQWKIDHVADTFQYVNLHRATVAIGDGEFVCEDWEKTVFFYPNPFKTPTGTMEITKLPVPGKMSIKLYNLAGDLVREGGYQCVDANNMTVTMGNSIDLSPDNTVSNTVYDGNMPTLRNAALRCFWDRTNDHGKKVARGVYFGLVDFRAQNGRQHCQKVVKILIPR